MSKNFEVVLTDADVKALSQLTNFGTWEIDLQSKKVTFSPQMLDLIRRRKAEYKLTTKEFYRLIPETETDLLRDLLKTFSPGSPPKLVKIPFYLPDKHRLFTRSYLYWKKANKSKKIIRVVSQDITEEVHSDAVTREYHRRFYGIFEATAAGMALVSVKGKWIRVNDALCKLLGYNREELHNMTFQDITHPDDLDLDLILVRKMLKGELENYSLEKRYLHKHGYEVWALLSVSLVWDDQGNPKYFVVQINDISQIKYLEQAKTEFLAIAAHQLRTPATSISWTLELLLDGEYGKVDGSVSDEMHSIYDSNRRMITSINDLLNSTRLEQGKFIIKPVEMDINEQIEQVIKDIDSEITRTQVKIRTKFADDLPKLNIDLQQFQETVKNLLLNAVKYSKKGGVVTITTAAEDDWYTIEFKDKGIGIPKKDHNNIYKRFFRSDNAMKQDTRGTGLGLYIVKSYLDIWGGKIEFSSRLHQGSIFKIFIPHTPKQNTTKFRLKSRLKKLD